MARNFTKKEILSAIKDSGGIVSRIAEKLQCNWTTANYYVNMYDVTKQAYADEKDQILDIAESSLLSNIQQGNMDATKYYLSKKGKCRGYGDNVELSGGVSVALENSVLKMLSYVTEEERLKIVKNGK